MSFTENYYPSADGLNLYYREYGEAVEKCPLLCLSGLTRNSGDFHDFAMWYSKDRKVYALDYRGRGKSDYDENYSNYNPQTYIGDIFAFLTKLEIERALFVGTSLGGMLTMGFAGLAKQYIAAAILNDVGPELNASGGARILDYVGKDIRFPTLEAAADAQKSQYSSAYPDLLDADWIMQSQNTFTYDEGAQNYRFNYDMKLGKALAEQFEKSEPVDLWPFFKALGDVPTLAIRGALSDVLSKEVFQKMAEENPAMQSIELANRGHVPQLDELDLLPELDNFIAGVR